MTPLSSFQGTMISLFDVAYAIETNLKEFLKPPTPGLYLANCPIPVMVNGQKYVQVVNGQRVEITDASQIVSDVFTDKGVPVYRFRSNEQFFPTPMVPTVGADIAYDFVVSMINRRLSWMPRDAPFHAKLDQYLREGLDVVSVEVVKGTNIQHYSSYFSCFGHPDIREPVRDSNIAIYCEDRVHMLMTHITDQILSFIGDNTWNVYHIRRVMYDVYIDRDEDYRIREWNRLRQEGHLDINGLIRR